MEVHFHHPDGHADVSRRVSQLMASATESLRVAVCFITKPGAQILLRAQHQLKHRDSFFVGSIDLPSDLAAFAELHRAAPGNIYIHMGGRTPEACDVGRSLMHSKVFLALNDENARLWTGSHNLTAAAMAGGNFEAGIELSTACSSAPIQDAIKHLESCRVTAELFDPSQMGRYREIQRQRIKMPPWITRERLLVIHAEAVVWPTATPFTVHLQVTPTDFDRYFGVDRPIRLFLHPPGTLSVGAAVDYTRARLWEGTLTGIVRTERHPQNRGMTGRFDNADFEIEMKDVVAPPRFVPPNSSASRPTTQVVLRITDELRPGTEVYSTSSESPVKAELDAEEFGMDLHEVDPNLTKYFTPESVREQMLVYRPVRGVKPKFRVTGYEQTMRSGRIEEWTEREDVVDAIAYEPKEPRRPVDAFFFLTTYVIRGQ